MKYRIFLRTESSLKSSKTVLLSLLLIGIEDEEKKNRAMKRDSKLEANFQKQKSMGDYDYAGLECYVYAEGKLCLSFYF